jgi:hypothetical protein
MQMLFDGYCPESLLKGIKAEMRLNEDDFWESEATGLQVSVFPPFAAVLPWRGASKFRTSSPLASQTVSGLMLVETQIDEGREFLPDEQRSLGDDWDLEAYILRVYPNKAEFEAAKIKLDDPLFVGQSQRLEDIPKPAMAELVSLFESIKPVSEGQSIMGQEAFRALHKRLYGLNIVFNFDWMDWKKGQRAAWNPETDYSNASLLELSMYLTVIFRSDRFNEGTIDECYRNGTLKKIFDRLKQLISITV